MLVRPAIPTGVGRDEVVVPDARVPPEVDARDDDEKAVPLANDVDEPTLAGNAEAKVMAEEDVHSALRRGQAHEFNRSMGGLGATSSVNGSRREGRGGRLSGVSVVEAQRASPHRAPARATVRRIKGGHASVTSLSDRPPQATRHSRR